MANNSNSSKTWSIVLKVLLVLGIIAGLCVIGKLIYDKYKKSMRSLCEDDCDCDFECLENDELDCDCDNCQYVKTVDSVTAAEVEA